MSYKLFSDSTCDLPDSLAKELDINIIPMQFSVNGKTYTHYLDYREMSAEEFYQHIKDKADVHSSQINYTVFLDYFDKVLAEGMDILYLCFTSGMSGTMNTCQIAVDELKEKYPDREILVVDSLCASGGEGYFDYLVANKMQEGLSLHELRDYAEDLKLKIVHWFVVDDLDQLKKGGRISGVTATVAKALQIKPLINVNMKGELENVGKIRGANKVYDTLISKMLASGTNLKEQTVMVGSSDRADMRDTLAEMVKPYVKEVIELEIGPVIGVHVGCGMCAVLFVGDREVL